MTAYQPTQKTSSTTTQQPNYMTYGQLKDTDLSSLFATRSPQTSVYNYHNDKRAAEPNDSFPESSSPRKPLYYNDFSSTVEPAENKPSVRRGSPRLTRRATYNRYGKQSKNRKLGPYKEFDRDEFHRDMLERHAYYRTKHEIELLEHDPAVIICVK